MKSIVTIAATCVAVDALPFMRIFKRVGLDYFTCRNPTTHTGFNASLLEGKWYQVAANWGDKTFGCLTYDFIADESDTNLALEVNWTKYNSLWNPFERGEYSKQYKLKSDEYGQLYERSPMSPRFSTILHTDYETYIVEYHCQQAYGDFYT